MKIKFRYIVFFALCTAVACQKDNYEAPTSILNGRVVYQGEAIGVETFQVPYELYQFGFGKVGPIGASSNSSLNASNSFAQDGSFSAILFDGDYKLIIPNGQGPFIWKKTASGAPDSVAITLRGSQTVDLEVMPYYMVRTPQFTAVGTDSITAAFKAEKIITDPAAAKDIERVSFYINRTQFVSGNGDQRIGFKDMSGSAIIDPNSIMLGIKVPAIVPAQNYVFARIGIKIAGVEDMIFSPVQKVQF